MTGMVQTAMSATLERGETKPATRRSVFIFRFASTIVLWSVALLIVFSGYELAFYGLISVVGLIALWEFYGMLDHKGLPNSGPHAGVPPGAPLGGEPLSVVCCVLAVVQAGGLKLRR